MKKNDDFLCHYGVPKMKWYEHDSNRRQQGENAYAKKRNTKGFILKDEKDIQKDKKPSWMSNRDYYILFGGKQIAKGLAAGGKKVLESLSSTPIEEETEAIEEGSKKFDRMLYSTIGILGRHVAKRLGISASITIKAPSSTSSNTAGKGAKEFDKMMLMTTLVRGLNLTHVYVNPPESLTTNPIVHIKGYTKYKYDFTDFSKNKKRVYNNGKN